MGSTGSRRIVIIILVGLLAGLGLASFYIYKRSQLNGHEVPILRFHRVTPVRCGTLREPPRLFDLQLRYLRWRGYETVSLEGLLNRKALPSHPIVITFDDGYEDNYLYAVPILRKYHFKAIIFVVTGDVGKLNVWDVRAGREGLKMMDWQQLRSLEKQGIAIGSHTVTHPYLTSVDQGTAKREIVESKKVLEKKLGKPVRVFAYPYGDANSSVKRMVKEAGYVGAVSVHTGINGRKHDSYDLRRIRVRGGDGIASWFDFFWFVWSF